MDLPKRKKIRLSEYDYSQSGLYFVTVCINKKRHSLWDKPVGADIIRPQKSDTNRMCSAASESQTARTNSSSQIVGADIIRPRETECFDYKLSKYGETVKTAIENISIHYPSVIVDKYSIMPNHIHMILFIEESDGRMISAPTISVVVGQMKRWVSKKVGFSIWQKSFYEHIIRNERSYREIWEYIDKNPLKYIWKKNNPDELL